MKTPQHIAGSPFVPPSGATENGGPVDFPNGMYYQSFAEAQDYITPLLESAVAAIGTVDGLPAPFTAPSLQDGIANGDWTNLGITPSPSDPPAPTDESVWEYKGTLKLSSALTVQGPDGQPLQLAAGALVDIQESTGYLATRATYRIAPNLDKNFQQTGQGATAVDVPVPTSLALSVTAYATSGPGQAQALATAYWVAPVSA